MTGSDSHRSYFQQAARLFSVQALRVLLPREACVLSLEAAAFCRTCKSNARRRSSLGFTHTLESVGSFRFLQIFRLPLLWSKFSCFNFY